MIAATMMTPKNVLLCCIPLLAACKGAESGPAPWSPPPAADLAAPSAAGPARAAAPGETATLHFKPDAAPAVPEPTAEDRSWKPPYYDPLTPLTDDGKPTYSNNWFQNNAQNWEKHLGHLAGRENMRYLEVGVFEGQSLIWMFDNVLTHPGSSAVAIDLFDFEGLEERFHENLRRAGASERVQTIKALSNDGLRPLKPDSFDLIYIDASHTGANVLRDAILSWDLLKVGGTLIFDDYGFLEGYPAAIHPRPVIDMFVTAFYKELEVVSRGWQLIIRRKPIPNCYDTCSVVGPYFYHWGRGFPVVTGGGTLYDPRTEARVPLSEGEHRIIEGWMLSKPIGSPDPIVPKSRWLAPEQQALAKKLNLL